MCGLKFCESRHTVISGRNLRMASDYRQASCRQGLNVAGHGPVETGIKGVRIRMERKGQLGTGTHEGSPKKFASQAGEGTTILRDPLDSKRKFVHRGFGRRRVLPKDGQHVVTGTQKPGGNKQIHFLVDPVGWDIEFEEHVGGTVL